MEKSMLSAVVAMSAALPLVAIQVEYAGADKAVQFAAEELRTYLKGAEGTIRLTEDSTLKPQEWRIEGTGGNVTLAGRDGQGQVYAAYAFLEKYAGFRWYAPDTTRCPDRTGWKLPDVSDRGRPVILDREMYVGEDCMDSVWRLRNKETTRAAYGVGGAIGSPGDCHTFATYYREIKDKLTPEMRARDANGKEVTGAFCPSHPAVRHLVAERMKEYIRADRAARAKEPRYTWPSIYELSQDDGGNSFACHCPQCLKLYEAAGQRWSGVNIPFASAVAAEIKADYPDVIVRTFAYSYTERAPQNDFVAPDNLAIRYCRSFLFQPLTAATDNGALLKDWDAHVTRKQVWGYWRAYSGPLFPTVKPRADIGAEMKFCRAMNVFGYFAESEAPLARSFAMLQHWLFLKLAEDPDQDVMQLADEFLAAYYGPAKPAIEKYLAYLERRERQTYAAIDRSFIYNKGSGHLAMYTHRGYLDRAFFETSVRYLDEAAALAKGNELAARHVAHERLVVDRSLLENLASLQQAGTTLGTSGVAERIRAAEIDLLKNWKSNCFPARQRAERIEKARFKAEIAARNPMPVPPELKGRDFVEWSCDMLGSWGSLVKDADSVSGYARLVPEKACKLPYIAGVYDPCSKECHELSLKAQDIPADGKFHLYRLGTLNIIAESRIYYSWSWRFATSIPTFDNGDRRREVWASVKLKGPTFVKGSQESDGVLIERVFLAKPQEAQTVRAVAPEMQAAKRAALAKMKELGPTITDFTVCRKKEIPGKRAAFYIDDVIFIFRDLAAQKPKSCWDHRFLGHLKEAHEKYGLKLQLNIFYRNDFYYGARGAEFTLKDMPDTWRAEFQAAKDWLKFGFHSYSEFPDYPWINASYEDVVFTWKTLEREVERFAGPGMFAKAVTPHWGPMSKEGCIALKDCGAKVIWVSRGKRWAYEGDRSILPYGHGMRIENARKPETAVYWRAGGGEDISVSACGYNHLDAAQVEKTKGTYNWIHDNVTGCNFKAFTSGGPCLNLYNLKDIPARFENTKDKEFNLFATHEEYFYKDYFAYQPDYCEKLFKACAWIREHGYSYIFIEEAVD